MDDRPDAATRRDNLDRLQPRLTPRPDSERAGEPMAEALERGDRDNAPQPDPAPAGPAVPLTESERAPRESLADLLPTPSAEPPEGEGQVTPPIAP